MAWDVIYNHYNRTIEILLGNYASIVLPFKTTLSKARSPHPLLELNGNSVTNSINFNLSLGSQRASFVHINKLCAHWSAFGFLTSTEGDPTGSWVSGGVDANFIYAYFKFIYFSSSDKGTLEPQVTVSPRAPVHAMGRLHRLSRPSVRLIIIHLL